MATFQYNFVYKDGRWVGLANGPHLLPTPGKKIDMIFHFFVFLHKTFHIKTPSYKNRAISNPKSDSKSVAVIVIWHLFFMQTVENILFKSARCIQKWIENC